VQEHFSGDGAKFGYTRKGIRNMPKKTFTAGQIIRKLRKTEVLISHILQVSFGRGKPSLWSARSSG
jgi:hypothetical protein